MERYIKDGVFYNGHNIIDNEDRMVINPTEEILLANGYEVYVEPEPTEEEKLNSARWNMISLIQMYDNSSDVNSFSINGNSMWLDHNTRQQLKTSIDAYEAIGKETVTKWFNGVEYTFPIATWKAMLAQLEVYAGDAKNVTEAHLAAVKSMTKLEDIEAFDHTAGYPEKLSFGE